MAREAIRRVPSAKLRTYLALSAAGALAGLTLGRPELVALTAPLALYAAIGLVSAGPLRLAVSTPAVTGRALEQEAVVIDLEVAAGAAVEQLDLELRPHPWLSPPSVGAAMRLGAGERREVRFDLRAERWGAPSAGVLTGRARGRFGLIDHDLGPIRLPPVRVFPRIETLMRVVDPQDLQATTGNRVARVRGDGIEFAEVRPFVPGDVARRVNWRVTARRGSLYVSERHPERNADVILFLDTFSDVGDAHVNTLVLAVRAATSLAARYLERKDRVGVIGFGGVLSGLGPRLGTAQLYRIIDALLSSEVTLSYVDKDVRFVPRQLLPAKALVIAITPMVDERSIVALFDLRRRGFDLAILDISPVPFAPPGGSPADALAHRLWRLRREALKARFEQLGVPVTEWREEQPLQLPIAAATEFRRRAQRPVAT